MNTTNTLPSLTDRHAAARNLWALILHTIAAPEAGTVRDAMMVWLHTLVSAAILRASGASRGRVRRAVRAAAGTVEGPEAPPAALVSALTGAWWGVGARELGALVASGALGEGDFVAPLETLRAFRPRGPEAVREEEGAGRSSGREEEGVSLEAVTALARDAAAYLEGEEEEEEEGAPLEAARAATLRVLAGRDGAAALAVLGRELSLIANDAAGTVTDTPRANPAQWRRRAQRAAECATLAARALRMCAALARGAVHIHATELPATIDRAVMRAAEVEEEGPEALRALAARTGALLEVDGRGRCGFELAAALRAVASGEGPEALRAVAGALAGACEAIAGEAGEAGHEGEEEEGRALAGRWRALAGA